ncbi:MAG: 1-acyl-sn-glycerol-3-phosphate acyltransferase [Pseudohongiellaceae bacterium]|jgi:1-acyl-sn-glycerol-3-phosphate acyltransferase
MFFYFGYVIVTILLSSFLILLSPFLSQHSISSVSKFWCQFVLFWLRLCCGVRYKITGLENLPKSPCVIVSNHQSSWETILFYQLVSPVSPILKKELLRIPFFGWALSLVGPIAIDRSKPRKAARSLLVQGVNKIRIGNFIILFPEGRRCPLGEIGKFSRSGAKLAIAAKVPVVPISHNAGLCWPPHRFSKAPGVIQINIGPPVDSFDRKADELNTQLRDWIVLSSNEIARQTG